MSTLSDCAKVSSLEICVEKHNNEDISVYVHDKLSSSAEAGESLLELEKDIIDKALGIFQWARLVIYSITKWYNDGDSLEEIHRKLARVPRELGEVYEYIFKSVINHQSALPVVGMVQLFACLRWSGRSIQALRCSQSVEQGFDCSPIWSAPRFVL